MIQHKDFKNFASKDETRPHLAHMHVIAGKSYITDGHRMLINDSSKDNGIYDIKSGGLWSDLEPYGTCADMNKSHSSPLIVRSVIPKIFGCLKTTGISFKLIVFLDDKGVWHLERPKDYVAAFSPLLFKELAEFELDLSFNSKNTKLSPCHIDMEIQRVIIMPKRGE